ncbi:Uncharacterised protein [Mycobacteroides abscessus subsp. abscessus]|nr:Uncharacterised protein [Mycobacteroides abscessus subsp. abscessus]SIK19108.1 Uncharacterised protein [Mycobacteroides abscessus subsp. abscessus]SIK89048.1 Uncharacterised protein [Mycobacteroides abscessus subsp. abscessus]
MAAYTTTLTSAAAGVHMRAGTTAPQIVAASRMPYATTAKPAARASSGSPPSRIDVNP